MKHIVIMSAITLAKRAKLSSMAVLACENGRIVGARSKAGLNMHGAQGRAGPLI